MTALDTHLQIILAGLAAGRTEQIIETVNPALRETSSAMAELGARIVDAEQGMMIAGTGNGCLLQPAGPLVFKADAVSALLMVGLLAAYDMDARIECHVLPERRDLEDIGAALGAMGAQIAIDPGLPWSVSVARQPSLHPVMHHARGWSDTVVAAVLLAALNTPGMTAIEGLTRQPSRLHTVFGRFAVDLQLQTTGDHVWTGVLVGQRAVSAAGMETSS